MLSFGFVFIIFEPFIPVLYDHSFVLVLSLQFPPSVSLSVSSLHAHSLSVITFKVMPFVLFIFYFLLFFESHFQINSHLIR